MAKTDGRGNPPWTRDETILALDLFFDAGLMALSDSDPRVIAMSETLRGLPGNEKRSTNPSFRNPAGVSFKLSNLQSVSTGRGFANVSAMDKTVWGQFGTRRQRVKEITALITTYVLEEPLNTDSDEDEDDFPEGMVVTRVHRRIERNRKLRTALIRDRRARNQLRCDACFKVNPTTDSRLDDVIFDAHHLIPLSIQGQTKTRLGDVALLCANCHRIIHRLISRSSKWASVEDVRKALDDQG
jgi:5-methylcytosine-specific restriction protein A